MLQIGGGIWDNSKFFLSKNKSSCYPSLELSEQDSSNEGSQDMFLLRNVGNSPLIITVTPSYPNVLKFWDT